MKNYIIFFLLMLPFWELGQDDEYEDVSTGTFQAGLIVGASASQIDGDQLAGYNKFGYQIGGRVSVRIKEHWEPSIEILFTQKGSRSSNLEGLNLGGTFNYSMNYVEIPVMMNYRDGGILFNAGLSYSRLVQVNEVTIADVTDTELYEPLYRDNELAFVGGLGYFFNKHFALTIRYSRSLFSVADYEFGTPITEPQVHRQLIFRGIYMF